jgi:hypothetical protein
LVAVAERYEFLAGWPDKMGCTRREVSSVEFMMVLVFTMSLLDSLGVWIASSSA